MGTKHSKTREISIIIPKACDPMSPGITRIIEHTDSLEEPFLWLMALRFWFAANSSKELGITISDGSIINANTVYIVRDFFADYYLDKELFDEEKLKKINTIIIRVGANLTQSCNPTLALSGWWTDLFYNVYDNNINFQHNMSINYGRPNYRQPYFFKNIINPLGTATCLLPKNERTELPPKAIFIDEAHTEVLSRLADENNIYTHLMKHAYNVCSILHRRGFKIYTFNRNSSSENLDNYFRNFDFVQKISIGKWIPYSKMLNSYKISSLFFNFFPETFGFSIYENLQMGNAVISYSEIANLENLRTMQNSVILSVFLEPELCADMVEQYWNRYINYNLWETIARESYEDFSADTFGSRLIQVLSSHDLLLL